MQNSHKDLEKNVLAGVFGCKTYRKPKRKAPVTIIIGLQCVDGILVVCDSRTTDPSGVVHDDAQKLNVVYFKDGNSGIVAESGNDALSSRAVEMIYALSKGRKMDDYRSLATCAEEAIADLKNQIRSQYKGTAEELQKHFEDYAFELMIAHYWGGEPFIFTLDFVLGLATLKKRRYVSIGCGWQLADFLISPLDVVEFRTAHGMWTAVYAVEQIKKFDSRCGGITRSAVIKNKDGISDSKISQPEGMEEAVREALLVAEEQKTNWIETAQNSILRAVSRRGQNQKAQ
jgi:20S proteasome alpha/beta subunit